MLTPHKKLMVIFGFVPDRCAFHLKTIFFHRVLTAFMN